MTPQDKSGSQPMKRMAIEELFYAMESPLLSYAMRLVKQREAAEDLVQEAFMRLHAQFNEVRDPQRWLYRTIHNLGLNYLRSREKVVPLTSNPRPEILNSSDAGAEIDAIDPQPLPDEQIELLENIGLVRLCLERLDERSRELVHLKFNENLSYKEMSQRTGLTVGHVGFLLHHALKSIANEFAHSEKAVK